MGKQRKFDTSDRTINQSGEANMMPPDRLKPDATTMLFDGFVRDGWMKEEDRMEGIACSYKGNLIAAERRFAERIKYEEYMEYRRWWVTRVLGHMLGES